MYARSSARRACVALSILSLSALGAAASAQTDAYYTAGTYTVDAAHSVTGTANVGLDSSGSPNDGNGKPYNPHCQPR